MNRTPHQLLVHLDWFPEGRLEIRYSYPFAGQHELREQLITVATGDIPSDVREPLEQLRARLRARHTALPVRFPSQEITPKVHDGILTVVTRDQRRSLPIARLYLHETIEGVSKVEKEARMESSDFGTDDLVAWRKVRQWANGKAWEDYKVKTKLGD
jgi:hypothetical protein